MSGDGADRENTSVYVSALPPTMNAARIRTIFSGAGNIRNIRVLLDIATGVSRGVGFVTYTTPEEAQRAIQMFHRYRVADSTLQVKLAREANVHSSGQSKQT